QCDESEDTPPLQRFAGPIVVIACMFGTSESWGPQQHHGTSRAGWSRPQHQQPTFGMVTSASPAIDAGYSSFGDEPKTQWPFGGLHLSRTALRRTGASRYHRR